MEAWIAAGASVLASLLTLIGVVVDNRKSKALFVYRVEQLEKKQDKHNNLIERTFRLEGRMNEAEHDIRDLKAKG